MAGKETEYPWHKIKTRRGLLPRSAIRGVVKQIVEQFDPDRIYLFGSYAYGEPNSESDIDLLVVMPTRNEIDQAVRVGFAIPPAVPLDVQVRTPANLEKRIRSGDGFLREVVQRGLILHEKGNARVAR